MHIGTYTETYFKRYGRENGLRKIKEHGYDSIDYQDFINTETDFFKLSDADFISEIKRQQSYIKSLGLTVSQAHAPWRSPVRDFEVADREERFVAMSKAIRGCEFLESPYFVVHPIMPFGANSSENADIMKEINYDFISRLADVGASCGVTVCLENMPFPALPITSVDDVIATVRHISHKNLKICLDTGHTLVLGDTPGCAARRIGKDLLRVLHVHDNDGTADQHLLPGCGIGDWQDFSDALFEIGFDGCFSFETGIKESLPLEEAKRREMALCDLGRRLAKIQ